MILRRIELAVHKSSIVEHGDTTDAHAVAQLLAAAEQLLAPVALYAGLGASESDLAARLDGILDAETLTDLRTRGAAMNFDETVALARSALARVNHDDQ